MVKSAQLNSEIGLQTESISDLAITAIDGRRHRRANYGERIEIVFEISHLINMDKQDILSLVVKSTLFNTDHADETLNLLERVLTPEYLLMGDCHSTISEMKKAHSLA